MRTARDIRRDATRLWRLSLGNGRRDEPRVRKVVAGLAGTTRSGAPAVLARFLRLLRLDEERWSARVESATPLDRSQCETLDTALVDRYGRGLTTTFDVNPALI